MLKLWILFFALGCASGHRQPNVVRTENGWVAGEKRGNYYAFEGLRFAAPPIGQNRFEPPRPYTEHWRGVRNFTTPGPFCLQWNPLGPGEDRIVGAEDCLFGNVYKPVSKPFRGYKFPVIIHIHGGGFQYGGAALWGPEHLMRTGKFVYAAFNYRLNVLGFLSTKSSVVPGNMGFKDQVMALEWVQRNIAYFDGDPGSVTITGFSAGGASVHLHYMSPLSNGLFHRGVSHSGSAVTNWALTKDPVKRTLLVAENVGCSNEDQCEMIECLKSKPAVDLVRVTLKMSERISKVFDYPLILFAGVVEDEHDGAFLTQTPKEYLRQRQIQRLPWLTSVTKDEGVFLSADLYPDEIIEKINSDWDHYAPLLFEYNTLDLDAQKEVSEKLKATIFDGQPISKADNLHRFTTALSQRYIQCAMEEAIDLQRRITPVYSYVFDYKVHFGFGEAIGKFNVNLGVSHGEDVILLFSSPLHAPPFVYTDQELQMSDKLLDMYSTFIDEGIPKFNDKCLTRSKRRVQYSVISGPEDAENYVSESICHNFWTETEFGDVY